MAASSNVMITYNTPCAACKFLRRKCMPDCIFAPYFPPEEPQKFANVHKIFGASNITKLLNELLPHQREDAVNSLAYEAEARVRDPVYGCAGAISFLQMQVEQLQREVDTAKANLMRYACCCQNISTNINAAAAAAALPAVVIHPMSTDHYTQVRAPLMMMGTRRGGISYYQAPSTFCFSWHKDNNTSGEGGDARQG